MENMHLTTNPEGFSTQNSPTVKDSVTKAQRMDGGYDNSSPLKPVNTNYTVEAGDKISVALARKPCAQIFQRVMITYDGRVAMCCMDWGAQHCIGYINDEAFGIDKTLKDLKSKIDKNKKGFELLKNAKYPKKFNSPKKNIETIKEIWNGSEINKIRNLHKSRKLDDIDICKGCDFTDTYMWKEIE